MLGGICESHSAQPITKLESEFEIREKFYNIGARMPIAIPDTVR